MPHLQNSTTDQTTAETVYVWARHAKNAALLASLPPLEVQRYTSPEDAYAAQAAGDDGFAHEALYQVRIEVQG